MTSSHSEQRPPAQQPESARTPDAAHLDEDAEALEDPVHSGDARLQHEQHERDKRDAG